MEDKSSRKSSTLHEKQKAVKSADKVVIREACRQLSIPKKRVQWWIKQNEQFRNVALS